MNKEKSPAIITEVNFTKTYPNFTLSCNFKTSYARTAIFGPSGSGKSTLLNCLSGFSNPDEGFININGVEVFSSKDKTNIPPDKRRLGYILQNPSLFPHMNVKQNIHYALNLTPTYLRRFDIDQIITLLEINNILNRNINSISGGEAQRVALARTLATSPELLLLDEPWTGLEKRLVSTIINYIKIISTELNLPLFFVSHNISDVNEIANEVIILNNGKISSIMNPAALIEENQNNLRGKQQQPNIINRIQAKVKIPITDSNLSLLSVGNVELTSFPLDSKSGDDITIILNSKDIILSLDKINKLGVENIITTTIENIYESENKTIIQSNIDTQPISFDISTHTANNLKLKRGLAIYIAIKSSNVQIYNC